MLRSRMFTPGFKLYFGLFGFFLVAALAASISTTLQTDNSSVKDMLFAVGVINLVVGPITMGWKGGVGNHLAYGVLLGAAGIAAFLAFVLVAFRDADPEALAEVVEADSVPLTRAPSGAAYTPLLAAVSVLLLAIGWVANIWALYAGVGLLIVTAGAWTIRAWADRATGDAEVNYGIYKQMIDPVRIPVVGAVAIAFVVLGFSRVLLAVPDENWSRFLFLGLGFVFFAGVVIVAVLPRMSKGLVTVLLLLAGLAMLGGLVWGTIEGEREIEGHGAGTEQVTDGGGHGGEAPAGQTQEGGIAPIGGVTGR